MKKLIVIAGATASGKTAAALALAQQYNAPILSADSRQFYREMSIGTAKPTPYELSLAKHYFINNLSIADDYSVGDYEKEAIACLDEIYKKSDVAILVGGSGLYINAVCEGLDHFPEISTETKKQVENGYGNQGLSWLQEQLATLDPEYFQQVDQQNPARLRRALEVCLETGLPYSSFRQNKTKARNFQPVYRLIELPRQELYVRINARVDNMIAMGLEEEVRSLTPYRHKSALKTVGYEEFFEYFDGKMSLDETVEKIKQHSRNYAKRQITWFKRQLG
jgi:tRNA dimethylallyltransferase